MTLIRPDLTWPGSLEEWLRDSTWGDEALRSLRLSALRGEERGTAAADFYEEGGAFHFLVELPGVSKEHLEVTVENAVIQVRASVAGVPGKEGSRLEFGRTVTIPDGVDPTRIVAELKNGLLHVVLPKEEQRKLRAIEVR